MTLNKTDKDTVLNNIKHAIETNDSELFFKMIRIIVFVRDDEGWMT